MRIERLDREQVTQLYYTRMLRDFPRKERRPLDMILQAMEQGHYDCLGILKDGEILGYAFFVVHGKDYLFDYLAIAQPLRNSGIGAWFLSRLPACYPDAHTLIGEVEDYSRTSDPEARSLQQRRLDFYLRNGLVDTGIRTKTYGVRYMVLELPVNGTHPPEALRGIYLDHYRRNLPRLLRRLIVRAKLP